MGFNPIERMKIINGTLKPNIQDYRESTYSIWVFNSRVLTYTWGMIKKSFKVWKEPSEYWNPINY
jgi:hypothetical protein